MVAVLERVFDRDWVDFCFEGVAPAKVVGVVVDILDVDRFNTYDDDPVCCEGSPLDGKSEFTVLDSIGFLAFGDALVVCEVDNFLRPIFNAGYF